MEDLYSNSRRDTWFKCEQLHHYVYTKRKSGSESRAMLLGTYIHENLEKIYDYLLRFNDGRFKPLPIEVLVAICVPIPGECSDFEFKLRAQAATVSMDYHNQYMVGMGVDKHLRVLGVEEKIILPLTTPKGRTIKFVQYIDLVVFNEVLNELWIVDHKTGKLWTTEEANHQGQQAIYLANLRSLGRPVVGAIINNISSALTKTPKPANQRFQRLTIRKSDEEIEGIMRTLLQTIDRMIDNEESPLMNLTTSCTYCAFDPICQLKLRNRDDLAEVALSEMRDKSDSHASRERDRQELAERIANREKILRTTAKQEVISTDFNVVDDDDEAVYDILDF